MPKRKKKSVLSLGRPPRFSAPKISLSSKATRTVIRSHHNLQKALAQAIKNKDDAKAAEIRGKIEEQGGLKVYQEASKLGQSSTRGGDSSKLLMQWLAEEGIKAPTPQGYSLLEVGALSTTNACSMSGIFHVTRIDLNSQEPMIEQQDFMERPLPSSEKDRFDVISLSLVLNYVPDAVGRGEMLKRTRRFLIGDMKESEVFPALFLVLPAPCITNSRYMTGGHLDAIMESMGYAKLKQKISAKLVYSLWRYNEKPDMKQNVFPKVEINPGKGRNNFSIIVR
jgi:25S rRNA (adenine2142-N1)-methyltransferase